MSKSGSIFSPDFDLQEMENIMRQSELIGEEILTEQRQIIDFDRKRNSNREALRELLNIDKAEKLSGLSSTSNTWMSSGNVFFKVPRKTAEILIQTEQNELDKEIQKLRESTKWKMSKINSQEGRETDPTDPFFLKPVNMNELNLNLK